MFENNIDEAKVADMMDFIRQSDIHNQSSVQFKLHRDSINATAIQANQANRRWRAQQKTLLEKELAELTIKLSKVLHNHMDRTPELSNCV